MQNTQSELLVQKYGEVTVVNFQNASVLDAGMIDALGRSMMDLVQRQDQRKLVLDFSEVRFMSSQALGILLQLKKAIDKVKGKILIAGIRPDLLKVFKITNLHKLFTFHGELDQALGEFGVYIPRA